MTGYSPPIHHSSDVVATGLRVSLAGKPGDAASGISLATDYAAVVHLGPSVSGAGLNAFIMAQYVTISWSE